MSATEFEIIRRYFTRQQPQREDVIVGIGDDAAVLQVPADSELLVCIDTLVAAVHFPESTPAAAIGHKALAVNLSDLAAMGATPAWATLSLTLPDADPVWLGDFSEAFFRLADRYGVALVGGDTTRGPLSVTVQAHGFVPRGRALQRQGAQPGDRIYISGTLGDAGLALQLGDEADPLLKQRLDFPQPRVAAGQLLRGYASAAIDVSDGLLADLGHLLEVGGTGMPVGASINIDALPRSTTFTETLQKAGGVQQSWFYELPLSAGDDYELCFTVPERSCADMENALSNQAIDCTAIGVIEQQPGIRCHKANGEVYHPAADGYQHFGGRGSG
ncbi:MAG: thiamine-phosphate kinase [Gammaproteobacteria bacterium]|jgi:thiamine-monophosphate kinase